MELAVKQPAQKLSSSLDVAELIRSLLKLESEIDQDKEHFWAIGVSSNNQIKYIDLVSLGSLQSSVVHPREVYRLAIFRGVAALIIAHNHPSGDPTPSPDDTIITRHLVEAGKIIDIKILDHVVVAGGCEYSFADKGLI